MKKYWVGATLICLTLGLVYYLPKREVTIPVPIEDLGLYDDIGIMAMESGDYARAHRYFIKSGNESLLVVNQQREQLKTSVLALIEKGMRLKHAKPDGSDVFKRLISIELLDDKVERNFKVVTLLLLAKISCEQGFKSWDSIAIECQRLSSELEGADTELSSLLYELSQKKVEV